MRKANNQASKWEMLPLQHPCRHALAIYGRRLCFVLAVSFVSLAILLFILIAFAYTA